MNAEVVPMIDWELDALEQVIEKGMASFQLVGTALMAIRDGRRYLATHQTFEAYCKDRWGFNRAHAYRLMDGAKAVERLSPIGDKPTHESQLRPIYTLPEDKQAAAWQEAVDTAPEGKVTAKHVQEVVDRIENKWVEHDVMMARHYATMAINQLEKITKNDPSKKQEGIRVINWCIKHLSGGKYNE